MKKINKTVVSYLGSLVPVMPLKGTSWTRSFSFSAKVSGLEQPSLLAHLALEFFWVRSCLYGNSDSAKRSDACLATESLASIRNARQRLGCAADFHEHFLRDFKNPAQRQVRNARHCWTKAYFRAIEVLLNCIAGAWMQKEPITTDCGLSQTGVDSRTRPAVLLSTACFCLSKATRALCQGDPMRLFCRPDEQLFYHERRRELSNLCRTGCSGNCAHSSERPGPILSISWFENSFKWSGRSRTVRERRTSDRLIRQEQRSTLCSSIVRCVWNHVSGLFALLRILHQASASFWKGLTESGPVAEDIEL
jgi:hypothetical protein